MHVLDKLSATVCCVPDWLVMLAKHYLISSGRTDEKRGKNTLNAAEQG